MIRKDLSCLILKLFQQKDLVVRIIDGIKMMGRLNAHVKLLLIDLEVQCGDRAQAVAFYMLLAA